MMKMRGAPMRSEVNTIWFPVGLNDGEESILAFDATGLISIPAGCRGSAVL